jgi:hypothetical protein
MFGLPEISARPVTKSAATQCDSSASVRIEPRPYISEAKEAQTTFISASPLPSQNSDHEGRSPSSFVQLQSPQPGQNSRARLHSARYRRHSPMIRQLTRAAKLPFSNFHREEIRGKVSEGPQPCMQKSTTARAAAISLPAAKQGKACLQQVEGKPAPGKAVRLLPNSSLSSVTIGTRQAVPNEAYSCFSRYFLGQATVPPQYALPSAYSQAFGTGLNEAGRRNEVLHVIAELLLLPVAATASYKVSQLRADYYVMTIGTLVPVSACCKSSLLIHLQRDSESEVRCTAWQCATRILGSFSLAENYKNRLWSAKNKSKVSVRPFKSISTRPSRSTNLSSTPDPRLSLTPEPPTRISKPYFRSPEPPAHPKSPYPNPFNLKDSVTFQPPTRAHLSDSPIRRIFAKSRSGVRMASVDELRSLWISAIAS